MPELGSSDKHEHLVWQHYNTRYRHGQCLSIVLTSSLTLWNGCKQSVFKPSVNYSLVILIDTKREMKYTLVLVQVCLHT